MSLSPIKQLFTLLALTFCLVSTANAANKEPFTEERFNELRAAGEVVLVDVFADWCPTCAKQQKVLQEYRENNPDKKFHVLIVDFDADKEWVRHFRAPRQSTLVLFAGDKQTWFSVAETRMDVIADKIDQAVAQANKGNS
ncbi:thioredoxin family protein [Microbulbifer agarilyticus]|uniref:thioredoxin family protein n=1 Tax=Microbulbifer agarilyticus TaxID=260552 RepID=UPI001C971A52|nr:thioredoxin family protein [Microbulbifer agarilyticus]MBY6210619.1 thioredoxin family protein [Microbulbifer agarilyticus]